MKLVTLAAMLALVVALPAHTSTSSVTPSTIEQAAATQLDRTKVPPPGKTPPLHVPVWTKATLSNGAELMVSEKHDLPLVSFSITFMGGSNQFEPGGKRGLASLTSSMLNEGTTTRNGEALSNALQLLGTSISTSVGGESGSMSFLSTKAKFAPTLDILADMLLNSTFPADALERLRAQRIVQLTQAKDQTGAIAGNVFPRVLYGSEHPFGQFTTEDTVKAITRDDVVSFQKAYFQPGRALITVVGDIDAATAKATLEKSLTGWAKGGEKPTFTYPATPSSKPTTIYLVDKPGATQSTFALGLTGPSRNTPDYYALQVMNTILGGMFQSRLNANIREEKGYSYGVSSNFSYGKGPGPFRTGGDVVTDKTDAALVEFMKELRGIIGSRPITDDEIATAKDSLIQRLPGQFASIQSINGAIASLWLQNLPDSYYQQYKEAVAGISKEDVLRVAKKYIDVDHLALVIVGDRASIEGPLKATNIAPITVLDIQGNPISK
jgi:zinc protease